MECESRAILGSSDHLRSLFARVRRDRVPVSGSFDLTYRCNYRCVHCYAGHLTGQSRAEAAELDTGQIVDLLKASAEAGCLLMLLSGGEPLLREDFVDIYVAAKKLGMVVTVFTNGSLVNDEHLNAFEQYPPHEVEVSVYGATPKTYERITGRAGSYQGTMAGISRLLERGIRVGVKTMILRENLGEIKALRDWAAGLGLDLRMDPLVTPRLDGDLSPLAQRVDPEIAVELEMNEEERRVELAKYLHAHESGNDEEPLPDDRLYRCGAGMGGFHLDAQGFMHPCIMSTDISYNANDEGFAEAWRKVKGAVDAATFGPKSKCASCPDMLLCGYCPALFRLERATPAQPPEYICRLGECRLRTVGVERPEVSCATSA